MEGGLIGLIRAGKRNKMETETIALIITFTFLAIIYYYTKKYAESLRGTP